MILHSLNSLYDRLVHDENYGLASPGYSRQKITFKVVLKPDGTLIDIQDARVHEAGRLRPVRVQVPGQTKPPGSGLKPCFLWDNSAYMLGHSVDLAERQRALRAFQAFRKRHEDLRESVASSRFDAVVAFLTSWDPKRAADFAALNDAAKTGFGVFQIQGEVAWVHDDPQIDRWWRASTAREPSGPRGQCLVSGEVRPLARLHDKIKGIGGTQGAGAPLVGFNEGAFESLGKSQSFNAPVSQDVAFRYTAALNSLLDGPMRIKHRITLGDVTVAFWTESPSMVEDVFARFLTEGSETARVESQDEGLRQKVEVFLAAMKEGRRSYATLGDGLDRTAFYMLGLSPNAGRVAVRFFHQSTVADLLDALGRHHNDIGQCPQAASGRRPGDPQFPPVRLLLDQTARDRDEVPGALAGSLLRAILSGSDYPQQLLTSVVRRIRADREINYARACAIKGYLQRNLQREVPMSLDRTRTDPAYRLGRLFAALEKTQKDALGEQLNRTIRDAFYGAASASPSVVFPRLMRTYQHHIAKLEGGRRVNRERLVQDILAPVERFPPHLLLPDQGAFAIGYYHQMRAFYAKDPEQIEE